MILIADSGSTKTDWVALNQEKTEAFRVQSLGLNPAVINKPELEKRIISTSKLFRVKNSFDKIYFYGAGCGTIKPTNKIKEVLQRVFLKAEVFVYEDILAAVYATSGKKPAIVCIVGTGSNSCYFNGNKVETSVPSLGYTIMDEGGGSYLGKKLLRHYFYKKMPKKISEEFENQYNLNPDFIKTNLYEKTNPNMYLASFSKFIIRFKDEKYIRRIIKKGFEKFFEYRVLPYKKQLNKVPIYFVGSVAFYFNDILEEVAKKYNTKITKVVQRPIDNLVAYHSNV